MALPSIKKWRRTFASAGIESELADAYTEYVEHLLDDNRPPILTFSHLAGLLGRTPDFLASAIMATEHHYRSFTIPKRRGGERLVSAPYPALLECQQWIADHIIRREDIHNTAHGFVRGRSIKTNAKVHLGRPELLKLDLENFFPSINDRRVFAVFRRYGYAPNIAYFLGRLCTLAGTLPQGSAASPSVSNVVAYRLDQRLNGLASKCQLKYTRYADDLTFSGKKIGVSFSTIVSRIVEEEGFRMRHDKTRLCRGTGQRIVTGIAIDSGRLRVPREFRRKLRQEIHFIRRFGLMSHVSKLKIRRPHYLYELSGKFAFWRWVEPDSEFAQESSHYVQELIRDSYVYSAT